MSEKSVAWEVEASEFCRGDRGELCAPARPQGTGLLSLAVRPGNMQGLLLATFLLAALSQVRSLSFLLPFRRLQQLLFFQFQNLERRWGRKRG